MTTTRHTCTVRISAPIRAVFDLIKDPNNMYSGWHTPVDVHDVNMTPQGVGTTYMWTARELGFKHTGVMTREEYVEGERIVDRSSTGPSWTWTLEPAREGTNLTLLFEYSTSVPLMDKVLEATLERETEDDMLDALEAIKARLERRPDDRE